MTGKISSYFYSKMKILMNYSYNEHFCWSHRIRNNRVWLLHFMKPNKFYDPPIFNQKLLTIKLSYNEKLGIGHFCSL